MANLTRLDIKCGIRQISWKPMGFLELVRNLINRFGGVSLSFVVVLAYFSTGNAQTLAFNDELKPVFSSGHFGYLYKAFFAADGKRMIIGGNNKTIKVLDIETGRELRFINAEERMSVVDYAAATDTVAGVVGAEILLWDALKGNQIHTIKVEEPAASKKEISTVAPRKAPKSETIEIKSPRVDSIQFSPDGKILAVENSDGVLLWDIDDERILRKVTKFPGSVGS
ncbi:MAG: hypothetical protein HKN25_01585, partial [Pyrinomonadaceae bacterium]|nr:hypothetical protein [Pyrinomonadaceae bacterium]